MTTDSMLSILQYSTVCRLVFAMCLLFGATAPLAADTASSATPPPPSVVVASATNRNWHDTVEALGTLRANETVVLTASVADTITSIHFDDGQRVEKGYVLARMTGEEETALVDEMTARLAEARRQFERVKDLPKSGAISESVYDQREREFRSSKAMLAAVESRLRDRLIVAPFDGVLGLRNISVGALVAPGEEIATLTDDSIMKLDFTVPSVFLSALKPDLPIVATTAARPDTIFEGSVSSINSQVDPVTRSIVVRAQLPNDKKLLKPGLLMTVMLQYNFRETLVIPEEALIPAGSGNDVLVVRNDTMVEKRPLEIGSRKSGHVEILAGLNAGDRVITHGTMAARPGAPVTILAEQQEDEGIKDILDRLKGQA